jgi:signal transduction histidine kinase
MSLGIMGFITSARQESELTDELEMQMLSRAQALAASLEEDPDYHLNRKTAVIEVPGADIQIPLTAVYIDSGKRPHNLTDLEISDSTQASLLDFSREPYPGEAAIAEVLHQPGGPEQVYAMAPVHFQGQAGGGMLCLLASMAPLHGYVNRQRFLFGDLIFGLSLLGVLSSILLTRPLITRAADVEDLAARVMHAGYQVHVPETGPREARQISHSLNQMLDRLQEEDQERRTILSNVTHELGRPLAGLKLGVESLQKGAIDSPELAEDLLSNMGQALQHMEMLLEDISLAISPVSRPHTLHRAYVSVEPFLQGMASRFWSMAEVRGVRISLQVPPDLPQVFADEQRLRQILGNLIHNAVKFTPRGGIVELSAGTDGENMLRITVRDHGRGLGSEGADRLFDPFYQGENGKRIQQGMGLGLSIALQLARLHGGSLELMDHPQGGAIAVVTLPAEPA